MKYDAVIVLGHAMDAQGALDAESTARMEAAIDLYHGGKVSFLVTSGWAYREEIALSLAAAMAEYAATRGRVPRDALVMDEYSRDTVGDAVFTKRHIVSQRDWKNILVVTHGYHRVRALEIFRHVYGPNYALEVLGVEPHKKREGLGSEADSLAAFRESFAGIAPGDDEKIFSRLCSAHPYYNGEIFPRPRP